LTKRIKSIIKESINYSILTEEDEEDSRGVFVLFHKLKVNGFHICLENGERVGVITSWIQVKLQGFQKISKMGTSC